MKRLIRASIVLSICAIFATAGIMLIPTIAMVTPPVNSQAVATDGALDTITEQLKTMYLENQAYPIAGVLYMEGIIFDIVMQSGTDNAHYLDHDKTGASRFEGELFYSNESEVTQESSIDMGRIYGHNMATGEKFGQTYHLLDGRNNRPLYYYDGKEISVFELKRGFDFEDGTEYFEQDVSGEQKQSFLEHISSNSLVAPAPLTADDTIFLQTCVRAVGDERYVYIFQKSGVIAQ